MRASTFLSLAAAGLASAVRPGTPSTWTAEKSPTYWEVTDFQPTELSFNVDFSGVYGKSAVCGPTAQTNTWVQCNGTLATIFEYNAATAELTLRTNITENNAEGLLYSINQGLVVVEEGETEFHVPLLFSQGFYAE